MTFSITGIYPPDFLRSDFSDTPGRPHDSIFVAGVNEWVGEAGAQPLKPKMHIDNCCVFGKLQANGNVGVLPG